MELNGKYKIDGDFNFIQYLRQVDRKPSQPNNKSMVGEIV